MKILNFILKHRDAFAISMVFASGPLNYALRDGAGLAPNSIIFTMLFMFGPMIMVLPFRNFKTLYKNDTPLTFLALVYIGFTLFYMFFYRASAYVTTSVVLYDCIVISIVLYFLFYISTVKESYLRLNFLRIIIIIAFLGCIGLLAFVFMNPNYILGQRFAIAYGSGSEGEAMGNPHTFGRGAFFGLVAAIINLKYETRKRLRQLTYGAILILFSVLILAQAMSAILAGMLFFFLYSWNNYTFRSLLGKMGNLLKKWYVWVFIIFMLVKGVTFLNNNRAIVDIGYRVIENRISNLIGTFVSSSDTGMFAKEQTGDASALGRVKTLNEVSEVLQENFEDSNYLKILFGNGFYAIYVDVPIVEVFHSYGIVGFLLFGTLFWLMIKYSLREMKKPRSIVAEFTAYGFIYFFVFTFTNGLIMDYTRWTFFAMVCRFMPSIYSKIKTTKQQ